MCPLSNEDLGRGGHIVLHSCAFCLLLALKWFGIGVWHFFCHIDPVCLELSHACSADLPLYCAGTLEQQRFQPVFWFTDCVSLLHMVSLTLALGGLEFDGRVFPH